LELEGEYNLKADREQVWEALNDPDVLKQCIPGCETLTKTSDKNFEASVVAKLALLKQNFLEKLNYLISPLPLPIKSQVKAKGVPRVLLQEALMLI